MPVANQPAPAAGHRRPNRRVGRGRGNRRFQYGRQQNVHSTGIQRAHRPILTSDISSIEAEVLRLLFHLGDVDYVDRQVSTEDFDSHYRTFSHSPYSGVILEVAEDVYDGFNAIMHYVADKGGLSFQDPTKRMHCHMLYAMLEDAVKAAREAQGVADKADRKKKMEDDVQPKLEKLNALIGSVSQPPKKARKHSKNGPEEMRPAATVTAPSTTSPPEAEQETDNEAQEEGTDAQHPQLATRPAPKKLSYLDVAAAVYAKHLFGPLLLSLDLDPQTVFPNVFHSVARVYDIPGVQRKFVFSSPQVKLYYFDMPGRAEAIRWALTLAGIEFEDVRISKEEWNNGTLKAKSPSGQLPMLQVGEEVFTESLAIMMWVAKHGGLMPQTDENLLHGLSCISALENQRKLVKHAMKANDPAVFTETCEKKMPLAASTADALIAKQQDSEGHVVGGRLSFVDLIVASFFLIWLERPMGMYCRDLTCVAPASYRTYRMVTNIPAIREFRLWPSVKPVCTLYYFDGPGRAEACKLALALAEVEWADRRVSQEEWAGGLKETLSPSKQLPLMEIEGHKIFESKAILMFVAEKAGLIPDTFTGRVKAEQYYSFLEAHYWKHVRVIFKGETQEQKDQAKIDVIEDLKLVDQMISEKPSVDGFVVEGDVSWVDLAIASAISGLIWLAVQTDEQCANNFPNMYKCYKGVYSLPAIAEYVQNRTPYKRPF